MQTQQSFADPDALMRRVSEMLQAGRLGVARPLLAAVKQLSPGTPRLAELSARLAIHEGRLDDAREELDEAVLRVPNDPGLRKWRAELRMRLDDLPGAAADAAEAVVLDRVDPMAKALLGTVLIGLGRADDAVACLREAVDQAPTHPFFHQSLAVAQDAVGDPAAATTTLDAGIGACPGNVALRNAAMLHRVRQQDFAGAVAVAEQARHDGVADATLYGLKGHALSSLERHDDAADAYAEALKLGPEDPYVRHLVAASGVVPGAERAPSEYLRAVFNGYADRFEAHLISLGYRVPGLLRARLLYHLPQLDAGEAVGPVLDLGCGTGLVAVAVSDLPLRPLVGVDLSPAMLRHAAAKQVYAELLESDVLEALQHGDGCFPVVIAADLLCYFGSLDALFAAVHRRLAPGGLFLFSAEETSADHATPEVGNWRLLQQGRYAHTLGYLERTATQAGFLTREIDRQTLRHELGDPVAGLIAVLQRGP